MKELWLATGLSGELGTQLKTELANSPRVELRTLDLKQPVAAQRVIHLAARRPVHGVGQLLASNIFYLRQVLRYAEKNRIPEFVFFSSGSLYARSPRALVHETDVAFKPNDFYAWTKWAGEKLVARSAIPGRLIVRLPGVLEVRNQSNFISRAFTQLQRRQTLSLSHLDQPFNWMISAAEVRRLLETIERLNGLNLVNLAPPSTHTLREVLSTMAGVLGTTPELQEKPSLEPARCMDVTQLKEKFNFEASDALGMVELWARQRLASRS